jgi:nucleoside-diphosphate-sugar epimerase
MPYCISKLAVEHLARDYAHLHGLECIHLRTSWVNGPGLPPRRIRKTFIDEGLRGEPLHMVTGGDFRVDQI